MFQEVLPNRCVARQRFMQRFMHALCTYYARATRAVGGLEFFRETEARTGTEDWEKEIQRYTYRNRDRDIDIERETWIRRQACRQTDKQANKQTDIRSDIQT